MNFRIIKRINYYLDWYSYRKGIDITSAYDTNLFKSINIMLKLYKLYGNFK